MDTILHALDTKGKVISGFFKNNFRVQFKFTGEADKPLKKQRKKS